jgi:predicted DNA-binding protein (UPF0251 family)
VSREKIEDPLQYPVQQPGRIVRLVKNSGKKRSKRVGDGFGRGELGRQLGRPTHRQTLRVPAAGPVQQLEHLAAGPKPRGRRGTGFGKTRWEWRPGEEREAKRVAKAIMARQALRTARKLVEQALSILHDTGATARQVQAFRLVRVEGRTQREAGRLMGIRQKNISKLLAKADARLR